MPLGKFGDPNDIGTMVAVLCSEQAKYLPGGNISGRWGTKQALFCISRLVF